MVRKWFAFLKYILLTGRQKDASPVNERSIIDKYIYKIDENRLKFDISVPHCIYVYIWSIDQVLTVLYEKAYSSVYNKHCQLSNTDLLRK